MTEQLKPQIWVAAIIRKDGKVLLGKRLSKLWKETRALPGWKLEYHEDIITCAEREIKEECWIEIQHAKIIATTNEKHPSSHRITFFVLWDYKNWKVTIREAKKCEKREWFEWEHLPSPLFLGLKNLYSTDFHPFKNAIPTFTT